MIKSAKHIERDLWTYLKNGELSSSRSGVNGGFYRGDTRPDGSTLEDVVVKYLSGYDEQFQTGIVIVNIYVPDIAVSKYERKLANTKRLEQLSELLTNSIEDNYDTEYGWYVEETPQILDADEINQHFVNARVRFNRFTERNQ